MASKQIQLKAWMLPLIVVGLVVPGSTGFLVGGPGVGLAVGGLCAGIVVLVAALKRPQEQFEVAKSAAPDDRRHLLVVADVAVDEPAEVEAVATAAGVGDLAKTDVLVVAPARNRPLSHWLSDVAKARDDAQVRLVHSIGALAAARVDARGEIGDPNFLQATEDALRSFPADEVILVTQNPQTHKGVAKFTREMRRRLGLPLTHLFISAEERSFERRVVSH